MSDLRWISFPVCLPIFKVFYQSGTLFTPKFSGALEAAVWLLSQFKFFCKLFQVAGVNCTTQRYCSIWIDKYLFRDQFIKVMAHRLDLTRIWCSNFMDSRLRTFVTKETEVCSSLCRRLAVAKPLSTKLYNQFCLKPSFAFISTVPSGFLLVDCTVHLLLNHLPSFPVEDGFMAPELEMKWYSFLLFQYQ